MKADRPRHRARFARLTPGARRIAIFAFALTTGCGGGCAKKEKQEPIPASCDAGNVSFVRNASLAVLGRRPLGQSEVNAWLVIGSNAEASGAGAGRPAIVDSMIADPTFGDRWADHFMDELRVPRINDQRMDPCWGTRVRNPVDTALASYLRDYDGSSTGDGSGDFTMLDLMHSSLAADDISPVYRAHLFPLVAYRIEAANVPRVEAELARRQDSGNIFQSSYLNRDMVCLGCHNSETAVTYDPDPAVSRHWPLPGNFEASLYGVSSGIDPDRANAMFRYDGFADGLASAEPWGMTPDCGSFDRTIGEGDPAGIDARFGTISGDRASAFDLEASLKRGVDSLAANGLQREADGTIPDPDQALAYLVGASIVEGVWKEVVGSPLTIANYFPRNEASRDVLASLTDSFVESHFSMRVLLLAILESEWFNRLPPEAGCGAGYDLANVYDPWVIADDDPARRLNSSADGIAALPPRVLVRSTYAAMSWPLQTDWSFPQTGTEVAFQRGIGLLLSNSERGFRGLDFQARLVWEDRFARCAPPSAAPDFVDGLVADALAQNATTRDVVLALKDRLLSDSSIEETIERPALESIVGPLDANASTVTGLELRTRRLCGVFLSTPQFLLGGFSETSSSPVPLLSN